MKRNDMKKNILLTGSSGKLGKRILKRNKDLSILSPSRKELDITSQTSVENFFKNNSFDSIVASSERHLISMPLLARDSFSIGSI